MRPTRSATEKRVYWIGSSKTDLLEMPKSVIQHIGEALGVAQYGGKHPSAKPWRGIGGGVFEIVSDAGSSTFRAAYAVRFADAVYVLHCFQKKSPSGIRTARTDVELIERRLRVARADYEAKYGQAK